VRLKVEELQNWSKGRGLEEFEILPSPGRKRRSLGGSTAAVGFAEGIWTIGFPCLESNRGAHKRRGDREPSDLTQTPVSHWIGHTEFNLWSVHRRSGEQTVEILHQEVLKPRQPLDRPELA
jgi:hypothetical protein